MTYGLEIYKSEKIKNAKLLTIANELKQMREGAIEFNLESNKNLLPAEAKTFYLPILENGALGLVRKPTPCRASEPSASQLGVGLVRTELGWKSITRPPSEPLRTSLSLHRERPHANPRKPAATKTSLM